MNGHEVGIGYVLKDSDRVEVRSDPTKEPEPSGLKLVRSPQAQRALGRWLHRRERAKALKGGKLLLKAFVAARSARTKRSRDDILRRIQSRFGMSYELRCIDLGRGKVRLEEPPPLRRANRQRDL